MKKVSNFLLPVQLIFLHILYKNSIFSLHAASYCVLRACHTSVSDDINLSFPTGVFLWKHLEIPGYVYIGLEGDGARSI